ncbi:MAG: type II secretion system F family protein [Phycisphaerales bacterium]|nr:type II secretion system F family protein [Phycisphaerales bacterium]
MTTGATKADAFRQLVSKGLTPVAVWPVGLSKAGDGRQSASGTIHKKELAHFTYQFGVLMAANITVGEALRSIAEQEKPGALRKMIEDLGARVQSGETIAGAMESHRDALGDVYVEAIRAAEKAGTLPAVLEHLSEMLERTLESQRQVRGALMYPLCVGIVLFGATAFLLAFVIPKFGAVFAKRGASLPMMTEVLLRVGQSIQTYWWVYLSVMLMAGLAVRVIVKRPEGRLAMYRLAHRVPYLRRILVAMAVSRFSRILGIGVASGLSLIECIELAGRASGRPSLERDAIRMADQVRGGATLSSASASAAYLTPFARRMLAAGERSGDIPKMCAVVSRQYEREASELAKNVSTVIEPLLVVAIAGVVLIMALAIFLPMWDSMKLVG